MSLSVNSKEFLNLGVNFIAVVLTSLFSHSYTAIGHKRALKGLVSLKSDNFLLVLIEISRTVRGYGGDYFGVHIKNTACLSFCL